MASGDAGRIWFPEIVAVLRERWRLEMTCEQLIVLRDQLDALLQEIRSSRKILPPIGTCPHCGTHARQREPRVSVRAMILALGRFGITDSDVVKTIERRWQTFRKQTGADLNGDVSVIAHHRHHQ